MKMLREGSRVGGRKEDNKGKDGWKKGRKRK